MAEQEKQFDGKLADFFAKINMSELPAMSNHVRELISLTQSSRSAAYELSKVILKDYSLTNKVLQVVNSAFYSLGRPVSSISRAVTVLGFDAVRDLATAIALFEDFVKAGGEKDAISRLMTKAFLSAVQGRDMVMKKEMKIQPEEAFICSLLHGLGKILVCIYAPDMFREIEEKVAAGAGEETAARSVLDDFTYQELGEEVAKFWNLGEKIIDSMDPDPAEPLSKSDAAGVLKNVARFSNLLVENICAGKDLGPLMKKYGDMFDMNQEEAVEFVKVSIEGSEDISDSIRYGLSKLKIRSKVNTAERLAKGEVDIVIEKNNQKEKQQAAPPTLEEDDDLGELPTSADKSINDYIHDLTETLMGPFNINDFYVNLLEGLYRGIGFDRAILAIINIQPTKISLIGRFGLGDIEGKHVSKFNHPLSNMEHAIPMSLKSGKDMAIPANKPKAFPEELRYLVKDRLVYLFPIMLDKKPVGMIYLDRKNGRARLDPRDVKSVRLLRDFAVMALRKIRKKK